MSRFERLKASPAWDGRYNVPTCPELNNPWVYGAMAVKLVKQDRDPYADNELKFYFGRYGRNCEVATGLLSRWPDGRGGVTSMDELIGIAYVSAMLAKDVLTYLTGSAGIYDNRDPKRGETSSATIADEDRNIFRFPAVVAFIKARAGARLNLVDQLAWCGWMLKTTFSDGEASGYLRRWLTLEAMESQPICGPFARWWKRKVNRKPAEMLKLEPREYPILAELAEGLEP